MKSAKKSMVTAKKKKTSKKKTSKKASTSSKKSLPTDWLIVCTANAGGPCVARAMMVTTIHEALASTVWYHRGDPTQSVEFVVHDVGVVPVFGKQGHFQLDVSVTKLKDPMDDGDNMSLHRFFQTFVPARELNVSDHQA